MRLTRAAMRAGAQVQDDTPDASPPHTDVQERIPLEEVSANTVIDLEPAETSNKKTTAKKGKAKGSTKKSAKGKKMKAAQDEQDEHVDVALADEDDDAGSPTTDVATHQVADEPTAGTCQHHSSAVLRCTANCGVQTRSKLQSTMSSLQVHRHAQYA